MKSSSFSLRGRRGQVKEWATVGVTLVLAVVAFVILALLLGAFKSSSLSCPSGYTLNTTADNCYLGTNHSVKQSLTTAGNVTNDGLSFVDNTSSQLPTAGTILGVSLLLVIIAGVGFAGYKMYNKTR